MNQEKELQEKMQQIQPADRSAMEKAERRQAELAKPPGSLGKLEKISVQMAGITGKVRNAVEKTRIYVLAADNGIVAEGVSSAPKSVTLSQAINLTRGLTGASSIAKHFGDELVVVDMGIDAEYDCPAILDRRIAKGTKNFRFEPAMSREQAVRAILVGMALADDAKRDGVSLLGIGEMGIGNTTTSSAVLAALTGASAQSVTSRGGGLTSKAYDVKVALVEQALKTWKPDCSDAVDVLSKVGGFDLCAMTGVFLGAAKNRIGAVIDGFISVVAALCAATLCPTVKDYLFPSHLSFERGYAIAAEALGIEPYLSLDMRLGEGSGCPIAFRTIEAALAAMNGMATFEEAKINDDYLEPIRAQDSFTVR